MRKSNQTSKREDSKLLQTSLKYSQITDLGTKLHFIDFIYDLEEFQNILVDNFTCVYLVDERDPQALDFLLSLEPLVSNFNNWINYYYTYHNRITYIQFELDRKLLWVFKGKKKIVQLQLTSDKKMRQMDELMQKLVQIQVQNQKSTFSSSIYQTNGKQFSSQASPEHQRGKRSKSIKRLVEEAQYPTNARMITRVQAKVTHRIPEFDRNGRMGRNERSDDENENENDSLANSQEHLFQLANDLEENQILDVSMSRLVKRLLVEENKEIIRVLQEYLQGGVNVSVLREQLNRIIDKQQNLQRPTSPFQSLKQASRSDQAPLANILLQQSNQIQQNQQFQYQSFQQNQQSALTSPADVDIEQVKQIIIERNNLNFSAEQYGMIMELWKQQDQVFLQLAKDAYIKQLGKNEPNLLPIQVYAQTKFSDLLKLNFKSQEIQVIDEYRTKRTSCVYAVIQGFRYESTKEFLQNLKKAIGQIITISQCSFNNQEQKSNQPQQSKMIQLINTYPRAPSPQSVFMPQLEAQEQHHNDQEAENKKVRSIIKTAYKTAIDEIFSEESFQETKRNQREKNKEKIQQVYKKHQEPEIKQSFDEIMDSIVIEQSKKLQAHQLFEIYDISLYEILKNYQTQKILHQTKTDLMKLLSSESHVSKDYRKNKMFNLFVSQVRIFTVQCHLEEEEANFLFKMFMDDDIQVLGTMETYLQNSDAQDMLENLQMIVTQYSKYINIKSPDLQYIVPPRKESLANRLQAKEIISRFRQYFSYEEKQRLEQIAIDINDTRIEQLYEQFLNYQDLNGFISSMKQITHQTLNTEQVLKQLQEEKQLKIDDFMLHHIVSKKHEQRVKGIFELYQVTKSQSDLVDNILALSKLFQHELITKIVNEIEQEGGLPEEKIENLKIKAQQRHKDYSKLCGAFSLYFEQAKDDKKGAMLELLETLNILC